MNFVLYYLLRGIFCSISISAAEISITKGVFLRRKSVVPAREITAAESRRTLWLRIFGAKRITVFTRSGALSFYLKKNEPLPFLPEKRGKTLRPKPAAILLGAFSDTRALSAAVAFSLAITRVGKLLGTQYRDRLLSAIGQAADELSAALGLYSIVLPRITALLAVFFPAAWGFAFLRRVLRLSRFRVFAGKTHVTVTHGLFTLYEQTVSLEKLNAAYFRQSAATLFMNSAPLYARNFMLLPALRDFRAEKAMKCLLRLPYPKNALFCPPKEALFSHCAVPLGWAGALAAGAVFTFALPWFIGKATLRSLLFAGAGVFLWLAASFALYMPRSRLCADGGAVMICARYGTKLVRAVIPNGQTAAFQSNVSLFQQKYRRRDVAISVKNGALITLRHCAEIPQGE